MNLVSKGQALPLLNSSVFWPCKRINFAGTAHVGGVEFCPYICRSRIADKSPRCQEAMTNLGSSVGMGIAMG
jgi:hypothetical protein